MEKRNRTAGGMVSGSFIRKYLHSYDMLMDGHLATFLDDWLTLRIDRAMTRARGAKRRVVKPLDFDM